ncbi:30S ribosomal protein S3 [Candidatus Aerophobetes bacterium]|uniref:Small ribosomal subunit protein uS3 n=1 Tax=Aerophobetes bacterium TaxID=2030807 RepID=A0A662DHV6_UNCAE|nr:MAG: 30S ribosomal protein S3 [Candidatus Aerophobetes bacterium]
MGQKVHPEGLRLGFIKEWQSRWYADDKEYAKFLQTDLKIRRHLMDRFNRANISDILIERATNKVRITIYAARPGIIIGRKGETIEKVKEELSQYAPDAKIFLNVQEIPQPELDAQMVADRIAFQLERRVSAKRAMREAISRAMERGAEGIKVMCKGRIGGAEIARKEWMKEGKIPLHTLRADVDYGTSTAHTTYGCIGVKVWIYKGDVMPSTKIFAEEEFEDAATAEKG